MLKFLYKTLLISVLSCSLMMVDFNSKGLSFQSAQAETVRTEGIKDGDMMATLTMVGVGILTSRLFMCKMTTDMMVAAAGGAAYLAGEVLATMKLRKVMKDLETEISRDSKGNINDEQIKNLERLKKSYEGAKKTANTKKMLQTAAAAAFLAAAVLSFTQNAAVKAAAASCVAALSSASGTCAAGIVTAPAAPVAAAAAAGEAQVEVKADAPGSSAEHAASEEIVVVANRAKEISAASTCPAVAPAQVTCENGYVVKKMTRGVCMVPPAVVSNGSILPQVLGKDLYASAALYTPANPATNIFTIVQRALISDARADLFSPMGIAGVAAIAYVTMVSKTIGVKIDTMLFSPMNRAIVYGVLAGLVFMASKSTSGQIAKMDSNIQKIDGILNGMKSMAAGTGTTRVAMKTPTTADKARTGPQVNLEPTNYEDIDLKGDGGGALPCFTGAKEGEKCKSFEAVAKDLPSFAGLNPESQQQISGILRTGDGFNGTSKITSGALASASNLAGQANALNSASAAARKKAQDALKASGSKIKLDDLTKKFSNDMERAVQDSLKKSNSTASGMMASIYGGSSGFGSGLGSSSDTANAATDKNDSDASKKGVAAVGGVIDISAGTAPSMDAGLTGVDTGATENGQLSAEELAKLNAEGKANSGEALAEFELPNNEISTDSTSNIFEVISNRYQRSGYPRLFKVKEVQEATPVKK